ncbi:Cfr family 23S rRNA (adenine(2503)-C(8))-methyltransferase [Alkalihalobacillus clausii]|uniref:Cfr family 23S rRNA (adenine(2503)-C(8))-methyltransferase n=1 Tax=Shouchella clausii TaxID=79880 RepID=UPI00203AA419|nr:Cfr family 23S rRNA (adenine(2503)-C(8))-methyltransferase [Shouchella clausii]MCM3548593.1 Cfr family 23S rRNA (adenine(2503)-C(8))-methyltransferase [Shouchella clausii]
MKVVNHATKYERLKHVLNALNEPTYRYKQITEAIFKHRIGEFEKMTTLPKALREALLNEFGPSILTVEPVLETTSQQVTKVLLKVAGNNQVEAVRMHYEAGWESFCISSQCGCGLGCTFCSTGAIGLKQNLSADEITDQLLYFYLKGHSLDSVSFMGMGEALANVRIFDALNVLVDRQLFALSPRRITVSTVGIIPNIQRMTSSFPQMNLTFSLHSPFHDQRSKLMPINNKYPLDQVMNVLDQHIHETGRKVYIAYVMLRGVNDSEKHAEALVKRILNNRYPHLYHVNLIRYNPTVGTPEDYGQTIEEKLQTFYRVVKSARIPVTIRSQFGREIDAACGQLYGQYQAKKR